MLERKSNETDAQYNARLAYFKCAEANARAALGVNIYTANQWENITLESKRHATESAP